MNDLEDVLEKTDISPTEKKKYQQPYTEWRYMREMIDEDVEYEYDEVTGARNKRPVMSALNKKKLSKWEMDELFTGEDG
jgi:hypothetical protein